MTVYCDGCKNLDDTSILAEKAKTKGHAGICRFNPPTFMTDAGSYMWPPVYKDDWCGQGMSKSVRLRIISADPPGKIRVIKTIREHMDWSLLDAKQFVEGGGMKFNNPFNPVTAEVIKRNLEAQGAEVEIINMED